MFGTAFYSLFLSFAVICHSAGWSLTTGDLQSPMISFLAFVLIIFSKNSLLSFTNFIKGKPAEALLACRAVHCRAGCRVALRGVRGRCRRRNNFTLPCTNNLPHNCQLA